jgi:ABC-2 type transport system ATP-binding protein
MTSPEATHATDPVISITNLSRTFGKLEALHQVTLQVPKGTVYGLVGENGAGKTTIIRHLLGLYKAAAGQVRVFGLDPAIYPAPVLGRIGYLSEDRDLPDWMRVGELMRYTRAFYPSWDDDYAEQMRKRFELDPAARAGDLSRGQRARLGLMLAQAHRPDLLLLDEPSSGLDPGARRDILEAVIRTAADEGRTVLLSSHLLDEVERVCDRMAMIIAGSVAVEGSVDDIKAMHRHFTVHLATSDTRVHPVIAGYTPTGGAGAEWSYVVTGEDPGFHQEVAAAGARITGERGATLDEILLSRAARARSLRTSQEAVA